MSRLAVDLVAFDLTGTLVTDSGVMESALKGALTDHGVPFTREDLSAMRGAGKMAAFTELLGRSVGAGKSQDWIHSLATQIHSTFKARLREEYARGSVQEISGAGTVMRWLREKGIKVAATTALDMDVAGTLLARLGWAGDVFDCVVSTEEVSLGRPAPYMIFLAMMRTGVVDVRRVMVVGDTTHDLMAGTNGGVGWVVGVMTGAHSRESLAATPHTHLLESVADLPGILAG